MQGVLTTPLSLRSTAHSILGRAHSHLISHGAAQSVGYGVAVRQQRVRGVAVADAAVAAARQRAAAIDDVRAITATTPAAVATAAAAGEV